MRRSLRYGSKAPLWVFVIRYAEQFGIPPWEFAAQCNAYWYERIGAYNEEIARHQSR